MKEKVKKLYDDFAKRFGTVVWKNEFFGVELALTENPYPEGTIFRACERYFTAFAMDKVGNRWKVFWYPQKYVDKLEDWNNPSYVELVKSGYYLNEY